MAVKLMADGPSFLYEKLVPKSWYKKFVYKSHTKLSKFLIRETWQMAETKNFKFQFFFKRPLHNQQNGKKTKKDEMTNNNQQQRKTSKQNKTSSDAAFQSRDSKFLVQNRKLF